MTVLLALPLPTPRSVREGRDPQDGEMKMSHGNVAPWRRRFFGRDGRFATGSLLFDLHRQLRKKMGKDSTEPHKTRLVPDN